MHFENLLWKVDGPIGTLTVNRPSALNALSSATIRELGLALEAAGADPAVRVVVVTGAGEKAFVAGADISELQGMDRARAEAFAASGQALFSRIEALPKPVVAAVNGYALGGGTELVLACDVVLAAETARFGLPEINLGIMPGFGGTQRLARRVGEARAKELVLEGKQIPAAEALRIGLVNALFPSDRLAQEARAWAERLAAKAPAAVALAKQAIHEGLQVDLASGLGIEKRAFGQCFETEDCREGLGAFLEKRKPVFRGR